MVDEQRQVLRGRACAYVKGSWKPVSEESFCFTRDRLFFGYLIVINGPEVMRLYSSIL